MERAKPVPASSSRSRHRGFDPVRNLGEVIRGQGIDLAHDRVVGRGYAKRTAEQAVKAMQLAIASLCDSRGAEDERKREKLSTTFHRGLSLSFVFVGDQLTPQRIMGCLYHLQRLATCPALAVALSPDRETLVDAEPPLPTYTAEMFASPPNECDIVMKAV